MAKTIREELKDMYLAEGGQQENLTNDSQIFKTIQSTGTVKRSQAWGIAGLTLVPADAE